MHIHVIIVFILVDVENGKIHQPLCLLSASMDKTMILWVPDEASGLWLDAMRVGEVGGNTLGFYGGVFSPDGNSILAHGFQGAFHLWHLSTQTKQVCQPDKILTAQFVEW